MNGNRAMSLVAEEYNGEKGNVMDRITEEQTVQDQKTTTRNAILIHARVCRKMRMIFFSLRNFSREVIILIRRYACNDNIFSKN